MGMLKKIIVRALGGLAVVIALLLLVGSFQATDYKVERSISINAAPATVWPWVSQLKKVQEWSPWDDEDPSIKIEYSGVDGTVGAGSAWDSEKAGAGNQHITALDTNKRVDLHLQFLKPFKDEAEAGFVITPEGSGSRVTWSMNGHWNLVAKVAGLFMNMDKMMGGEFEKGLRELKLKAEADQAKAAAAQAP